MNSSHRKAYVSAPHSKKFSTQTKKILETNKNFTWALQLLRPIDPLRFFLFSKVKSSLRARIFTQFMKNNKNEEENKKKSRFCIHLFNIYVALIVAQKKRSHVLQHPVQYAR